MPPSERAHKTSYTGRARRTKTRLSVKLGDAAARVLITVGGIGTIVTVCFVFLQIGYVALPLFHAPSLEGETGYATPWAGEKPVRVAIDEYQSMGWALMATGELRVFRLDTGETIEQRQVFSGILPTAVSTTPGTDDLAFGFDDGSIRFGRIGFEPEYRERMDVPEGMRDLAEGDSAVLGEGVVQRTPVGQFRIQRAVVDIGPAVQLSTAPILRLDHLSPPGEARVGTAKYKCCVYSEDGRLLYCNIAEKKKLLGGVKLESQITEMELDARGDEVPFRLLIAGRGDNAFVVWPGGLLARYDTSDPSTIHQVEVTRLVPGEDTKLTVCDFVLARETVVCCDTEGAIRAWFRVRNENPAECRGSDGFEMAMVHDLGSASTPAVSFSASQRSRMIALGFEGGSLRVDHVTTDQMMLECSIAAGRKVENISIAPKDNGLFAATADRAWRCALDPAYPEATAESLFGSVWYEGYNKPQHRWESSFAGVASEMKLGLQPMIFGTLKATFYSMLFGAPLALLAAIYSSEFLNPRIRSLVKPVIEMMASLPSVVLGFLAMALFAPFVDKIVPAVLSCFVTVPISFLLASHLWHLIPYRTALRLASWRPLFMCLVMPIGFIAALLLGPLVERWLFSGDIKSWLDGQVGDGTGGWMFLMFPISASLVLILVTLYVNTWLRGHAHRWTRGQFAVLNLCKFLSGAALTLALAYGLSCALSAASFDPRGTYVDTYVQRNALVVGFVMGLAIIPIIYTIADDALTTVPNHLRSGSLGCGATPWQTTWRIVVPTAMSGLFSALMIGLGRAVGETMIVLMAAGNTAIFSLNVFDGFRTLAANIAVELPEAAIGSTHYRTLFLSALTLFAMTFVINTIAEAARLRFRKRAYQL